MNAHLANKRGHYNEVIGSSNLFLWMVQAQACPCLRKADFYSPHYRIKVHFHHRSIISTLSMFLAPRLNKPIVEHRCRNSICSPRYSAGCFLFFIFYFFQPRPHLPIGSPRDSGQKQRGEGLICYAWVSGGTGVSVVQVRISATNVCINLFRWSPKIKWKLSFCLKMASKSIGRTDILYKAKVSEEKTVYDQKHVLTKELLVITGPFHNKTRCSILLLLPFLLLCQRKTLATWV